MYKNIIAAISIVLSLSQTAFAVALDTDFVTLSEELRLAVSTDTIRGFEYVDKNSGYDCYVDVRRVNSDLLTVSVHNTSTRRDDNAVSMTLVRASQRNQLKLINNSSEMIVDSISYKGDGVERSETVTKNRLVIKKDQRNANKIISVDLTEQTGSKKAARHVCKILKSN